MLTKNATMATRMLRTIKRYENRKLYDVENRTYISLEQIAVMIRAGAEVQVIENTSGNDITSQTLMQVIVEEGKKGRNPLSSEAMHEVIRMGSHFLEESVQQLRDGIDRIVPDSLHRIWRDPEKEEIEMLKKRISDLEGMIENLVKRVNT